MLRKTTWRTWGHPRGVWGAAEGTRRVRRAVGTIPAGAGSRPDALPRRAHGRDHSRGCGEQMAGTAALDLSVGPSLRARGAPEAGPPPGQSLGAMPAGAGSAPRLASTRTAPRDNPRGCGERCELSQNALSAPGPSPRVGEEAKPVAAFQSPPGSSPRARGARHLVLHVDHRPGTIPAGAGAGVGAGAGSTQHSTGRISTRRTAGPSRSSREHSPAGMDSCRVGGPSPRVRGALPLGPRPDVDHGTIPAVRGARLASDNGGRAHGAIPAGAGSMPSGCRRASEWRDHPRGCGERDQARCPESSTASEGNIPAGAWSRPSECRWPIPGRDPRGCGEQACTRIRIPRAGGPSARVRGAAHWRGRRNRRAGTIPAECEEPSGERIGRPR